MVISQEQLEKNNPQAAANFKRLYDQTAEDIDKKRWNFWCGWDACDRLSGHFSQDEIDWIIDCFTGAINLSDEPESFIGILNEMRKGRRD